MFLALSTPCAITCPEKTLKTKAQELAFKKEDKFLKKRLID